MENLDFWNSVEKTDPKHTKQTKSGARNITAIDPQWQRKNATNKFGMFGKGWGVKNSKYWTETFLDVTIGHYQAVFWYKSEEDTDGLCEFDISSNVKVAYVSQKGKSIVDDEWMKKCSTDALTKGLSALGFNADVFLGRFDDNKYVNQMKEEFREKPFIKNLDAAIDAVKNGKTSVESITSQYNVKNEELVLLKEAAGINIKVTKK